MRHLRSEGVLCRLRQARHHRGLEDAGCDGHDPNLARAKFPSERQGHPGHTRLRRGISGLTDLPGLTLILSDLQLGDGTGDALLDLGLPAVLMTALPPGDPRRAGLNCPVLTKPFDETEFAVALAGIND